MSEELSIGICSKEEESGIDESAICLRMGKQVHFIQDPFASALIPYLKKPCEALEALDEIEETIQDIVDLAHRNGVTSLAKFKFKDQCGKVREALDNNRKINL